MGVVDCRPAFDPGRRTLSGDARRDARRTVDAVYRRAARRRNYGYRAGRLQQRYAARLGLDARDGNHGTFAGDHADGHAHRVGRGDADLCRRFLDSVSRFLGVGRSL